MTISIFIHHKYPIEETPFDWKAMASCIMCKCSIFFLCRGLDNRSVKWIEHLVRLVLCVPRTNQFCLPTHQCALLGNLLHQDGSSILNSSQGLLWPWTWRVTPHIQTETQIKYTDRSMYSTHSLCTNLMSAPELFLKINKNVYGFKMS